MATSMHKRGGVRVERNAGGGGENVERVQVLLKLPIYYGRYLISSESEIWKRSASSDSSVVTPPGHCQMWLKASFSTRLTSSNIFPHHPALSPQLSLQ